MRKILKIEKHLYERPNHTVSEIYWVYREPYVYRAKYPSELTPKERETFKAIGKTIFHF